MIGLSRKVYYYQPDMNRNKVVFDALNDLANRYPAYGFGLMFDKLRQAGFGWNHKRVYRVYCAMKLNLRRKYKRRLPSRHPQPLVVPAMLNHSWSMDFMSDSLSYGRRFRTLNIMDDFNREILAIEIDLSLPGQRVVRVLERIATERGYPTRIRMDNGPEFISKYLADWAEEHQVQLDFIQPGRPMQNGFIERFNRTYRTEVLDMYLFDSLEEVKQITEHWQEEYNQHRPHQALHKLPPVSYAQLAVKNIGGTPI